MRGHRRLWLGEMLRLRNVSSTCCCARWPRPCRTVCCRSSGTMNNLTIGGFDERTGEPFAYYETIAGGMGARPDRDGVSGVHTHMTNSLNTPAEALEYAYPLRVTEYSLRKGSGGAGKFRGGDGIVREVELLADCEVTLLADRRSRGPYGLQGGADGAAGRTEAAYLDGTRETLQAKPASPEKGRQGKN